MEIEIRVVEGSSLLNQYIGLPGVLYKDYKYFVAPLYNDERDFHDPEKNRHIQLSTITRVIAFKNKKAVGRVMGLIYHPWNELHQVKTARFFQFDCINDTAVAGALLEYIELWARDQRMNTVVGPFGFSDKDPQGIQVEGFSQPPVIASASHPPYLMELLSHCGYTKFKDCVSYLLPVPNEIPEMYKNIHRRILKSNTLKLIEFKNRNSLKPFFKPIMELMNSSYKNIYGFVPLSETDIRKMAKQYLSLLNPRFVKMVVNETGQPVAFVIAMANLSSGFKKAGGRLFPFGFIYLLYAMKKSTQLDLLLGAVDERYRGRGLNVLMGISLFKEARKLKFKFKFIDSHLILEENRLMCAEMERLGGKVYKRYRIYHKALISTKERQAE